MKSLDLKSLAVAAAIGAVVLGIIVGVQSMNGSETTNTIPGTLAAGAVVGAVVQVGLRFTGVS